MKKLLILFITLFTAIPVFSMEVDLTKVGHQQKYINEIGFRILNANKIERRTNFYYEPNRKTVNAWSRLTDRQITVTQGMLAYVDSDDEMAALLSHEISHSVDSYDGAFKGYFSTFKYSLSSKKYETKADKRAVDYMVKAGYNPVAIIVLYNKFMSQTRYDYYLTHPLTSRRMATVYEYIYRKFDFVEHIALNAKIIRESENKDWKESTYLAITLFYDDLVSKGSQKGLENLMSVVKNIYPDLTDDIITYGAWRYHPDFVFSEEFNNQMIKRHRKENKL